MALLAFAAPGGAATFGGEFSPEPFSSTAADELVTAAVAPAGFEETAAFSGLTNPTAVRFAPDGRIFVAEKDGLVKVFDNFADPTPTVFADLRTQVQNFWDRGLLGLVLDPNITTNGFVYVLYTRDEEPFSTTMPRWGDTCPTPPGATDNGCMVTGTLSRLDSSGNETKLIAKEWCQQYPSHSIGSLAFGADGMLYVSGGEGASFNFADYGQDGSPVNPCGDPPGGVGANLTPPTAEGGSLRSQDLRTSGDPAGLDGSILRVDPSTGAAAPGNPLAANSDPNARRIIAQGLRNPFRITVRPGTNEVWVGDVGSGTWEEINRIANPTAGLMNFGWPCYEGPNREEGFDALNVNICENLYASGAVTSPYYTYNHGAKVVPGESCPTGGSSISGLAFYTTGPFPDSYDGALFFSDYTRGCIWVMFRGANGLPDPATLQTFDSGNIGPVDLQVGPDGALYYPDLDKGTIQRIRWPNNGPTARASAMPNSGDVPLTVNFDGTASSDPDPLDTLSYAWDLDGNGAFNDSTAAKPNFTYTTRGTYTVRLRVTDTAGVTDVTSLTITAGTPPTTTIDTPTAGTTFQVGTTLNYSGSAQDGQGNPIPASGLSWKWNQRHCARTDPNNCHTHVIETVTGVASGSFTAPDHEYPSYLELELTATDANGLTTTVKRRLDPRTVDLTLETSPAGLQLGVNTDSITAPATRTVIVGSSNSLSAPSPQSLGATSYAFSSWSDGGAVTHTITAPATATTYRANFTAAGATGLVAAYGFDEGSGTAAGDSSGRGNTGTLAGGALWSTAGKFGNALAFDGINDMVTVPDANSLDLTSALTLEAWVNPSVLGDWRTTLLKEQPGGLVYSLYGSSGNAQPSGYVNIGGDQGVFGSSALTVGVWAHLTTTYDGTTQRIYLNGTQVGSRAQTGAIATSTGALRIGGNSVWGEWFAGRIDEVRVYNRALPVAEIAADMNKAVGPQPDPVLSVTPTSLSFTASEGGADPASKTVAVSNATGGPLNYTTSSSASWLGVSPASGSAPATVTVAPHVTGLTAGTYTGTVTIAAAGAQGSPKEVSVMLTVSPPPPPVLAVSPASLTFSATVDGANPAAQTVSVTNTGSGAMSWTASDDAAWLSLSPASGSAPGSPSASVSVAGLAAGTYTATITVTAAGATGSPKQIPVTLNVNPANTGLVAAYGFNEGSGTAVADSSGRGNAGTVGGGAAWSTSGRFGSAVSFDGVNDMVTVPDANSLDLTTGMTLEAWVNPSALGDWRTALLKERPGGLAYSLYTSSANGRPSAYVFISADRSVAASSALTAGTWAHVATTYDGATQRIFMNGTQVGSRAQTGAIGTSTGALRIGGNSVWGEWFAGRIDEVRVYNRALTATEIQTDMNTAVG